MSRILHLGLGNFHRAHQAWYTAHGTDWAITGVVMQNRQLFDDMLASDRAFLLGTWGAIGLQCERMSVYDDILLASENPSGVTAKIADPQTQIVTLTITENGYRKQQAGVSAIGLLAVGLVQRAQKGAGPITLVSCDNLNQNGRVLEAALMGVLEETAPETLVWFEQNVACPNTMVDRITPALSDEAKAEIRAKSDSPHLPIVGTEAFTEWVIEDRFAGARPSWDRSGAEFVPDVGPFEDRKLRLLNASHSYLAYAGLKAGHTFVHEAIADPVLRTNVEDLWDEASVTIPEPAQGGIAVYRAQLLDRFAVPEMRHALRQIAMDGSLKLKERLVPIAQRRAALGLSSPVVEQAIESWIGFVRGRIVKGIPFKDANETALRNTGGDREALLKMID